MTSWGQLRTPTNRHFLDRPTGFLLIEAVVAAFLMIMAFGAAAALFDAALRWESDGIQLRRAAFLAEKKLEELRAWSLQQHSGSSFSTGWAGQSGVQAPYPEAPEFEIEVFSRMPSYRPLPHSGFQPPDGFHSPSSTFYTPPPGTHPRSDNPYPANPFLAQNPQYNYRYKSYPYSRTFDESFRMVEIVVRWGRNQEYRLISVLGDPLLEAPVTVRVVPVSGGGSLGPGGEADYRAEVTNSAGAEIEDIVVLWEAHPTSTAAADLRPMDANGRTVRVQRPSNFGVGGTFRLQARVRYRGQERFGLAGISMP